MPGASGGVAGCAMIGARGRSREWRGEVAWYIILWGLEVSTMREGELEFTEHARKRCQQRGINPDVVDVLYRYGRRRRSGQGGISYAMDKGSRVRARRGIGDAAYRQLEGDLDCYIVVVEDGTVVTVARRLRRHAA